MTVPHLRVVENEGIVVTLPKAIPGRHCKNRQFEWTMAFALLWTGVFIMVWPHALAASAFSPILDIKLVPAIMGQILLVVGLLRCVTLWHNGLWPKWGPVIRASCAVAGGVIFLSMDVALIRQVLEVGRPPSPGIPIYTAVAVSEFVAMFRAIGDVRGL